MRPAAPFEFVFFEIFMATSFPAAAPSQHCGRQAALVPVKEIGNRPWQFHDNSGVCSWPLVHPDFTMDKSERAPDRRSGARSMAGALRRELQRAALSGMTD